MKLSLPALRAATAKHLSPSVADGLEATLDRAGHSDDGDTIDLPTAAAALALAIIPTSSGAVDGLRLRCAELTLNGLVITLSPLDVMIHPLLRDWVAPILSGAVAQVMLAGAAFTTLAPGAPVFDSLWFRKSDAGDVSAAASLTFRSHLTTTVQAFYGPAPSVCGLATSIQVSGDALFLIGQDAARPPAASHGLEQDAAEHATITAAFVDHVLGAQECATLH